jgi:hypothetical protein
MMMKISLKGLAPSVCVSNSNAIYVYERVGFVQTAGLLKSISRMANT